MQQPTESAIGHRRSDHAARFSPRSQPRLERLPTWVTPGEPLGLPRNHYDRVGHFAQGFIPVIIVREVLLRCTPLVGGKMLAFLSVSVCLALSAFNELIEWWVVVLFYSHEGPDWLGHQGDPWDAQWDMTMCTLGAVLSLVLLTRAHDKSMASPRWSIARRGG